MKITIGIPSYNRPQLLGEALASIARQRDFADFEVVVCDDGGLPETRRVVEACGLRNLRFLPNEQPLGAVRNWNRCVEEARGDWVTILHEDDLLYPWFLKTVAGQLRDGVAAVCMRSVQGVTPPSLTEPRAIREPRPYLPAWFLKSSMTPFPGVVFSRELALRLGLFDPRQGGIADYAFWYALAVSGPVLTFQEPGAFYRVGEGQWTERVWPAMLRTAHLLRLRIAREQLPERPRLARWMVRFYTSRMRRSYARRFPGHPALRGREAAFDRIPLSGVSSGWVWALLRLVSPRTVKQSRGPKA